MTSEYQNILRSWKRMKANPFIYEHLAALLPDYLFRRINQGTPNDRWTSPLKIDLSCPKKPNPAKTVVSALDLKLREQGDWDNPVPVTHVLMQQQGFSNENQFYYWLSERYNLGMPMPDSAKVKGAERRSVRRQSVLEAMRDYFCWCLWNSRTQKAQLTRDYLLHARGFTEQQAQALQFGFVPLWSSVLTYLHQKKGFSEDEVNAACSVLDSQGRTAVGNTHTLAIPYVCGGVLKGFLFRRTDSDAKPKYLAAHSLDRSSDFFNYPEEGSTAIVIVEGELDALTATAEEIPGVVAIGGAQIAGDRRHQMEHAFSRGTDTVILCPDLDETTTPEGTAVPDFSKRLDSVLQSVHTIRDINPKFDNIFVTQFDTPTDPHDFIRRYGKDAFVEVLRGALPWWKFIYLEKERDLSSCEY